MQSLFDSPEGLPDHPRMLVDVGGGQRSIDFEGHQSLHDGAVDGFVGLRLTAMHLGIHDLRWWLLLRVVPCIVALYSMMAGCGKSRSVGYSNVRRGSTEGL